MLLLSSIFFFKTSPIGELFLKVEQKRDLISIVKINLLDSIVTFFVKSWEGILNFFKIAFFSKISFEIFLKYNERKVFWLFLQFHQNELFDYFFD